VRVTEATAYNFSAYFNGVDIISGQVAALPRLLYRRVGDEDRERANGHPVYKLLVEQPNEDMVPFLFWQTFMAHVLTWGNAYAEIEFDKAMRPIGLWPIDPPSMQPIIRNGRLRYLYQGQKELEAEDVFHVPGLGFDGRRGYSVVAMARQSLGLGLAAEQFGGQFFGNGAWPGIVLEHPGELSKEAQERLVASWNARAKGPNKTHSTIVLEENMTAQKIGIPPEDAQFLETREFQVEEIARWLNLPPHKLKVKVGERPGGNLEASQLEFLTDCLRPWLIRVEQEANRKLIPKAQRGTYYVEHLVDSMLRVDSPGRMDSYETLVGLGVMTPEQVAAKENLPKPQDKEAPLKERIEQLGQLIRAGFDPESSIEALGLPKIKHTGQTPVTVKEEEPDPPPAPTGPPPPPPGATPPGPQEEAKAARLEAAHRALLVDLVARFVRKEAMNLKRAAARGGDAILAWAEEWYGREQEVLRGCLVPGVRLQLAVRGVDGDAWGVARRLAGGYVRQSQDELLELVQKGGPPKALEDQVGQLAERWESMRPLEMAERITGLRAGEE